MKKLLKILSGFTLITTQISTTVSCGTKNEERGSSSILTDYARSQLNDEIYESDKLYNESANESGKPDFKDAINKAKAVANNSESTKIEIDQVSAELNRAINEFKEANKTNYDELNDKIAEADKLLEKNKNVNGKSEFQIAIAINQAKAVANNYKASQKEVDQAVSDLNQAIAKFKEDTKTNYTELNDKIAEADKLYNKSVNESGKSEFQIAINQAKAVANNSESTQKEVDQAVSDLNQATAKFKEDNKTEYDELNNKITEADKLYNESANESGKPDFKDAIDKAKAIANNPNAIQEEIDRANQDLNEAMEKFKKENYRAELNDKTAKAEDDFKNMSISNTPDDGKDILWFAIQNANNTFNNKNATAGELHQAIVKLKEASDKFETRIPGNSIGLGGYGQDRLGDQNHTHYSYTRGRLFFDKEGNNLSFITNPKTKLHNGTYSNNNYLGIKILDNIGKIIYKRFLKGSDIIEDIFNDPAFKNIKLQENFVIRFLWLDKREADKSVMYNKSSQLERLDNTTPKTRLTSDETNAKFNFGKAFKFMNGSFEETV